MTVIKRATNGWDVWEPLPTGDYTVTMTCHSLASALTLYPGAHIDFRKAGRL